MCVHGEGQDRGQRPGRGGGARQQMASVCRDVNIVGRGSSWGGLRRGNMHALTRRRVHVVACPHYNPLPPRCCPRRCSSSTPTSRRRSMHMPMCWCLNANTLSTFCPSPPGAVRGGAVLSCRLPDGAAAQRHAGQRGGALSAASGAGRGRGRGRPRRRRRWRRVSHAGVQYRRRCMWAQLPADSWCGLLPAAHGARRGRGRRGRGRAGGPLGKEGRGPYDWMRVPRPGPSLTPTPSHLMQTQCTCAHLLTFCEGERASVPDPEPLPLFSTAVIQQLLS